MSEQRLWFDKVGTGKAYIIRNITNNILGSIEYRRTGAFMHYVFVMPLELMKDCIEKNEDIYFSPGCLDEVRQKIKELNAKSCVKKDNLIGCGKVFYLKNGKHPTYCSSDWLCPNCVLKDKGAEE